jgi:DNA polymerase phi
MAAEGFILLYSLTLLQVYNGEGDAVMMLDDLDTSRKAMLKKAKGSAKEGSDVFVEIILSFLGNPRTLFRKIGEEALSIFASEISAEGLSSLTDILDTEENLEGQKELFNNQDDDDDAEEGSSGSDSEDDSDVEMIDGEDEDEDSEDDASDASSASDSDSSASDEESEDDAELTQFNNMLALTLQTSKLKASGDSASDTSDESDMDDDQMMALDPHLSNIFKQRSKISKKKQRVDAKQNVVQFKAKVLDLLAIYLEKQYSNPLTLNVLLPILRRTRASANKHLSEKASKLLKTFFDSRNKHKAPLPKPSDTDAVFEILKEIHEEAKLGGGAKIHADACSSASLHIVKVLVGLDRANYDGVVDVYAESQKGWFKEKKSGLQPVLFTAFQNWSLNARQNK